MCFLCIWYFFDQLSAWVFLIRLFFYTGWTTDREHTILLSRERVNKGTKGMNSLPLSPLLIPHATLQGKPLLTSPANTVVLNKFGQVNQWSVPAILLFTKNADYENEKCLKIRVFTCILQSKQKRTPFF